ncbi:unnamed protein product [Didymodactylos carnosus]|uniref:P/Homo B domain-containing protein n=1 Tax=Didymodactylos carnosus TaxID=1234261 RepID=A0A813SLD5_9BILA|nr:unnamed protein product [Didymodactylos carnosus]CAF1277295.1 unnamed protein product [Didymodactylos carnosus]CAF3581430.1 unnamed protein product [Didymodactylos carnosus]CAF4082410.1 unnamed protein product [Didymodactylos carnosus]
MFITVLFCLFLYFHHISSNDRQHFYREVAVYFKGSKENLAYIIRILGYDLLDEIPSGSSYFILQKRSIHKRSLSSNRQLFSELKRHFNYVQFQHSILRVKRDYVDRSTSRENQRRRREHHSNVKRSKSILLQRNLDTPSQNNNNIQLRDNEKITLQVTEKLMKIKSNSAAVPRFDDPEYQKMWYLNDQTDRKALDMNIPAAWDLGVSGKGITVTITDDGIEYTHPDLKNNYDPLSSTDINDRDSDPMPRYDETNENKHGTRCAGEVAAVANNKFCMVGVAYKALVGDGRITDRTEAESIGFNQQHINIVSASWGPDDDGRTVDGPGRLCSAAFQNGILYGRNGKGQIYVWAAGNGGRDIDNCNCDGYTNSPLTMSVSSATEHGTSASAPLAAAIVALVLEANPDLTWRDMQYIVILTARPLTLRGDWKTNGIGLNVSNAFGFGMMNAEQMVRKARQWKSVPKRRHCIVETDTKNEKISPLSKIITQICTKACRNTKGEINYLEHVEAALTIECKRRGDIMIFLTSPHGTNSTLLDLRRLDDSDKGFTQWPFMTVHNWGEQPQGCWKLEIANTGMGEAELNYFTLYLHGVKPKDPLNYKETEDAV